LLSFKSETGDLEFDAFTGFQPAHRAKNSSMVKCRSSLNNRANKGISGTLETRKLRFWKINIKRVRV
jgi:hypothetical protein